MNEQLTKIRDSWKDIADICEQMKERCYQALQANAGSRDDYNLAEIDYYLAVIELAKAEIELLQPRSSKP